jgi:hypothetical protein
VAAPYQEPSPASLTQPNVIDIAFAVDKVKDLMTALPKPHIQLKGNDPDPNETVNVIEIAYTVDAVKSSAYPFTGPSAPCP